MTFNARAAVKLMESLQGVVDGIREMPEMQPMVQHVLTPIMGGNLYTRRWTRVKGAPKRTVSAARRKQMSIAAKKRWAAVKRAGKTRLGDK